MVKCLQLTMISSQGEGIVPPHHTHKKLLALLLDGPLGLKAASTCLSERKAANGARRIFALDLEKARRPCLTDFHSAKPQTAVGVLRVLTVSFFVPAITVEEGNNFSLRRLTDGYYSCFQTIETLGFVSHTIFVYICGARI